MKDCLYNIYHIARNETVLGLILYRIKYDHILAIMFYITTKCINMVI